MKAYYANLYDASPPTIEEVEVEKFTETMVWVLTKGELFSERIKIQCDHWSRADKYCKTHEEAVSWVLTTLRRLIVNRRNKVHLMTMQINDLESHSKDYLAMKYKEIIDEKV